MCIWNGEPFRGNQYEPSVRIVEGEYVIYAGQFPQTANTRYWQLLSYGIDEAHYQLDYITRINQAKADLIGTDNDTGADNTIKGQHNYIVEVDGAYRVADTALELKVTGTSSDDQTKLTLYGIRKYAETIQQVVTDQVIGTDQDTKDDLTLHGLRAYADNIQQVVTDEVIGSDDDTVDTLSLKGVKKRIDAETTNRENADSQIRLDYAAADNAVRAEIVGNPNDAANVFSMHGLDKHIQDVDDYARNQIFSIGYDDTLGTVYLLMDNQNTLVVAEDSYIDQTTGEVIVELNL
jgi:hypothetical protein